MAERSDAKSAKRGFASKYLEFLFLVDNLLVTLAELVNLVTVILF